MSTRFSRATLAAAILTGLCAAQGGGPRPPIVWGDYDAEFPSASSTLTGASFDPTAGTIGPFWSSTQAISETFSTGLAEVSHLDLSFYVENSLAFGGSFTWEFSVNGTVVGSWWIRSGQPSGPVDLRFSFTPINGNGTYTVSMHPVSSVFPGGGSIAIRYPGELQFRIPDPLAPPRDLSPGDFYRVLVVTDGARDALSPNISDYNTFVSADANAQDDLFDLSTRWRAVASTSAIDARDNTGTNATAPGIQGVPVYLRNGTRIADNYDDLWDGSLFAAANITASGVTTASLVWTGSIFDGTPRPIGQPGSFPLGNDPAFAGNPNQPSATWMGGSFVDPSATLPLYALSDVLVVPLQSSEVERLGTPANPSALLPGVSSGPVVGETWDPAIDHSSFLPDANLDLLIVGTGSANVDFGAVGTLLCTVQGALLFNAAPGQAFAVPIPDFPIFVGAQLFCQGASTSPTTGLRFTNALDVTIGTFR